MSKSKLNLPVTHGLMPKVLVLPTPTKLGVVQGEQFGEEGFDGLGDRVDGEP